METHLVMKNNAMFLLELSSGSKRIGSSSVSDSRPKSSPMEAWPGLGTFHCLLSLVGSINIFKERQSAFDSSGEVILRRKDSDSIPHSRVSYRSIFIVSRRHSDLLGIGMYLICSNLL